MKIINLDIEGFRSMTLKTLEGPFSKVYCVSIRVSTIHCRDARHRVSTV
ncbi:MAG: hypothetical protein VSS75_033380 [Candidatus Parabeggiatoa sp.]|nr:hypothetical protein [Candidatus Parabeggiatoa sp.]